jgi:hypothetical protein
MVGQSSGTLPTMVQILVLAPFSEFFRIYRRYALSGKRRSRRRRDAISDSGGVMQTPLVNSGISRSAGAQSFGGAHRGRLLCNSKKKYYTYSKPIVKDFGPTHRQDYAGN